MLIGGAVLAVALVVVVTASGGGGESLSLVPPQSGPLGAVPPPLVRSGAPARKPEPPKKAAALRAPPPPLPAGGLDEALRALLREGRKIEAIKVYREQTGRSLKEAKEAVEAVEALDPQQAPPAPVDLAAAQAPKLSGRQLDDALLALLRAGRKIEAIKMHREQKGSARREAKAYADALDARRQ